MIDNLPAYPAYRDSGLPWVGAIPAHWDILRNGRLFTHRVETGFPDLPILEVSLRTGVRVRDLVNLKRKQMMTQKEKYKRAVKGDIAYNMMRMWQGALGVAPVDGLVSPAYVVVRPFDGVSSSYYDYLFRTGAYMSEVNKYSRGIVSDRNRLYWDEFKQMPSIIPPRDEQDKIVAFLRAQDLQIARFIRDKRRLIELLNEQKQIIIHRAVTRGLDPNVRLRPSGIDWLGNVPEHWEIERLKHVVQNVNCRTSTKNDNEIYVALEHIESWSGVLSTPDRDVHFESQVRRFQAGDVLFGKLRPYLAKVTRPQKPGVCVSELLVLRIKTERVLSEYIEQLLRSKQVIDVINGSTTGAKMPRADWSFIGNLQIAFPSVIEQKTILDFINADSAAIAATLDRTKQEIDLIREYRERLISDVVTGKVDLRGWTPTPEDLEADDEALAVIGDDEEIPAHEEDGDAND